MLAFALAAALAAAPAVRPGEEPVDPYAMSNANAGTAPFQGAGMWRAFHEGAGVRRVVDNLVDRMLVDPRIADIFKGQDIVRLRRTLFEQLCYILNGGCDYTGRDMVAAHKDMGLQAADMGALVEALQHGMDDERVPFGAQNRLLAKLAPMKRMVQER